MKFILVEGIIQAFGLLIPLIFQAQYFSIPFNFDMPIGALG